MISIELIRNKYEQTLESYRKRNFDIKIIEEIKNVDQKWREVNLKLEKNLQTKNALSNEITEMVKNKKDISSRKEEMKKINEKSTIYNEELLVIENQLNSLLQKIPNVLDETVPNGKDEKDNITIKHFLSPTKKSFTIMPHFELLEKKGYLLSEEGVKISGARNVIYKGNLAKLARSLETFMLDHNTENGYEEVKCPELVLGTSLFSTGQLPKFKEDLFKIEGHDLFLSPTSEVQVTNIYKDSIIDQSKLPIKITSYSHCFRSEAGSAGKDTRGIIRMHQFNKVETVIFCTPETSKNLHEQLTENAERILEKLELPYRRILLCSGDTGFSSSKTYDLEVWMPASNCYREISSCSNFSDFQSRRGKMRYKDFKSNESKTSLIHTLNGSALAIDRCIAAIIENNQQENGDILIPKNLVRYMNGIEKI